MGNRVMLTEQEVQVFVKGATRFFETSSDQLATVGSPYLATDDQPLHGDFTGEIDIDGVRHGKVYFTASKMLLSALLICMSEPDHSEANLRDVVGEVANTISGNARRDFGGGFRISVPAIHGREFAKISVPEGSRPIVIPINWRRQAAKLIVCLS
jgi:chemotaxis protein CheX